RARTRGGRHGPGGAAAAAPTAAGRDERSGGDEETGEEYPFVLELQAAPPPCGGDHAPGSLPGKSTLRGGRLEDEGYARRGGWGGVPWICGGVSTIRPLSRSGGTGRRGGLKIRCPRGRVGSSPTFGIAAPGRVRDHPRECVHL